MSPEQIATGYGVEVVAGLSPSAAAYVQGIMDSTPDELAAAFGNRLDTRSAYVQGIMQSTPEELAAAFGH